MLTAIVLSLVVLISYQFFFMPTPQTPQQESPPSSPQPDGKAKGDGGDPAKTPAEVPKPVAVTADTKGEEKEIRIDSDLYTAVLSSRGGVLKSVELKDYRDQKGNPTVLKADNALPPYALGLDETFQFSGALFAVRGSDAKLTAAGQAHSVTFEYSGGGVSVRRTYTFHYGRYGIDLKDEVTGPPSYWITLGKDFGIHQKDDSVHFGPVLLKDADRKEFTVKDLKEPKYFKEGLKWIAQEDKYFFASLVPKMKIEEARVWNRDGHALVAVRAAAGSSDYFLYVGPKEHDRLQQAGFGLEHIIDFGFFSILAIPLFWVLKQFYYTFHNYGIAITVLTVLVRIPFIPLVNMGQKSMKKMQDMQPKMAEVREKYKNDPQKMQKELMELYKKYKVNPVSGCLPMIVQIPVFFALYTILSIAIELRGAPFVGWIQDLSSKDPYYVLPIIMGVTMVIQQKMTPSTMDPVQQKIMLVMPIVFTFLFISFPSGLVLYWLINNILGIGQQYYINKKIARESAAALS